MVIDADTHITSREEKFTLKAHQNEMDRTGIDRCLCWLSPHHYTDALGEDGGNRYVSEAAKMHPDRIIGFGWAVCWPFT